MEMICKVEPYMLELQSIALYLFMLELCICYYIVYDIMCVIGKSREQCRPRTAWGREWRGAGNGVRHVECKAENIKGPGAALSTWGASCQGESLEGYLGYPHGVVREPRAW